MFKKLGIRIEKFDFCHLAEKIEIRSVLFFSVKHIFKIKAKTCEEIVKRRKNFEDSFRYRNSFKMNESIKKLLSVPDDFIRSKSKNTVIVTLVNLFENNQSYETLLVLAKCIRVYPKIWQYVHKFLKKENPPFQLLLDDGNGNEPMPKRMKKGTNIFSKFCKFK